MGPTLIYYLFRCCLETWLFWVSASPQAVLWIWMRRIRNYLGSWIRIRNSELWIRILFWVLTIIKDSKKVQKKNSVQYFIIFYGLLPIWQHFFKNVHRNFEVGSGSCRILSIVVFDLLAPRRWAWPDYWAGLQELAGTWFLSLVAGAGWRCGAGFDLMILDPVAGVGWHSYLMFSWVVCCRSWLCAICTVLPWYFSSRVAGASST
jgi:hypothetical protein